MIFIKNPKHLFECITPSIPDNEEIIWRYHPTYPIRVNQIGILDCTSDDYDYSYNSSRNADGRIQVINIQQSTEERKWYSNIIRGVNKDRLVLECWNETEIASSNHLAHLDNNPYNYTPDNIVSITDLSREERVHRLRKEKEFTNLTIKEMVKIQNKWSPDTDFKTLWDIMGIPSGFVKAWELQGKQSIKDPIEY